MNLNKIGRNEVVREGKEVDGSSNESIEYLTIVRVLENHYAREHEANSLETTFVQVDGRKVQARI